jgi:hypothetical protein
MFFLKNCSKLLIQKIDEKEMIEKAKARK